MKPRNRKRYERKQGITPFGMNIVLPYKNDELNLDSIGRKL